MLYKCIKELGDENTREFCELSIKIGDTLEVIRHNDPLEISILYKVTNIRNRYSIITSNLNFFHYLEIAEPEQHYNGDNNSKYNIPTEIYNKLKYLGLIDTDIRKYNVGKSNYHDHFIQPWSIWLDYPELTSWDHDIIKRVLRTKEGEDRIMDYQKIIHICKERIRQLKQ